MINKDNAKLALLLMHLRALYKTSNNKRGLIDVIDTKAKHCLAQWMPTMKG